MLMFKFRVKMCVKQTDSNVTRLKIGVWSIVPYSTMELSNKMINMVA